MTRADTGVRRRSLVPRALLSSFAALLLMLTTTATAAPPRPSAVVSTDEGLVRGQVHDEYRLFQGIPYAEPPVGDLRWRPPRPAAAWNGVRDATYPRSRCPQPTRPGQQQQRPGFDEDCLYLNVTTPVSAKRTNGSKPPVMVWVHGGNNETGSGSRYDARELAVRGNVVVVTINYRLGALGFLAHPALEVGDDRKLQAGNYGLLDQQAALRWVQRNAKAFGGNPNNVTLFGESSGSADSCANLASPEAAGLFHKVIAQSYSCTAATRTEREAQRSASEFAARVGCGRGGARQVATCLRRLDPATLVETGLSNPYPVAGGDDVLPLEPRTALRRGRFNKVPVMHGNTLDEMRLFIAREFPEPISAAQYEGIVRERYPKRAAEILARYPAAEYPSPRIALATAATDGIGPLSTCRHLEAYRLFAGSGVPTYAYQFADRDAPSPVDVPDFDEGAAHTTELEYLFPGPLGAEPTPPQQRLSESMMSYWTSFARRGRPSAPRAPEWPRFHTSDDVLSLAPGPGGVHTTNVASNSDCAYWKKHFRE
ncbi:para-nitrobenzyl esterase [Saccharopolyspora lacisalsi]|uniref:Carboxylic ester hydrolase n=1 Tax=Halosaccharopolyspora lacisalsi TaxID=1000566 RepID=A0A839E2B2_9PSEU|nr:carboxylesterase/lipase family protein [Halosaccharopolyspora lacisalsi]MBA8825078.1 para-nitrobenzyl esterase [Halosaccharopolyspora lacisalsi]